VKPIILDYIFYGNRIRWNLWNTISTCFLQSPIFSLPPRLYYDSITLVKKKETLETLKYFGEEILKEDEELRAKLDRYHHAKC